MKKTDDKTNAMLAAALIGSTGGEMEISPITVKLTVTPFGVSSRIDVRKRAIEIFHAEEWLKETEEKLAPIMREQTDKFSKLFQKKFGVELTEVDPLPKNSYIPVPDILKWIVADILAEGKK